MRSSNVDLSLHQPVLHVLYGFQRGGVWTFVQSMLQASSCETIRHEVLIVHRGLPTGYEGLPDAHVVRVRSAIDVAGMFKLAGIFRRYTALCIHSPLPVIVLPALLVCRRVLAFQHGMGVSQGTPVKRTLRKAWFNVVCRLPGVLVICSTEFARKKAIDLGIRLPHVRTRIVPFGIDLGGVRAVASRPPDDGRIRVLMAGVLSPTKRFGVVLESLRNYRGRHRIDLSLAGDGPERSRLEALADSIRSPHVGITFHGEVSNMDERYGDADLLVHPGKGESFGLVVLEALVRRIPVAVIADVGGCLPLLRDGLYGYIIEGPGDLPQFWDDLDRESETLLLKRSAIAIADFEQYNSKVTLRTLLDLANVTADTR